MRVELKEDQDIAIGCRVLIQNAIILWNCLKLSEKILQTKTEKEKRLMKLPDPRVRGILGHFI